MKSKYTTVENVQPCDHLCLLQVEEDHIESCPNHWAVQRHQELRKDHPVAFFLFDVAFIWTLFRERVKAAFRGY